MTARHVSRLVGVVALLAVFLLPRTAAASDGIFTPVPVREQGIQVDVAAFSPQGELGLAVSQGLLKALPGAEDAGVAAETYVVQSGDTLSEIAARYRVEVADLAAANGLQDPDQIQVGQSLVIKAGQAVPAELPPGGDLQRVQFWPWPPVQGQTLSVWLEALHPVTFTVSLDGVGYPVIGQGQHGWALIPIPPLIAPGDKIFTVAAGDTEVGLQVPVEAGTFDTYHIPAGVARPILDQGAKVRDESAELRALMAVPSATGWTPRSRFISPLQGEYAHTSPFGSRRTYDPNPAVSAHEGEDFAAPAGTPVTAPAAGVVVLAEQLFVRGNAVVLDHGSGVFTGYWHMQEIDVAMGDRVEEGQLLGLVGSTGLSTGAHLHWEMRVNGVPVDPLQWVEK